MSALTLTLKKSAPRIALDLGGLLPASLKLLKPAALRRLRVPAGGSDLALGELFDIEGEPGDTLRLLGLHGACHRVGAGLREGVLEVRGDVGDELGREMRGGELRVRGDAGMGVGQGMRGGFLSLSGSAGDATGGAPAGATRGMNGGLIVVGGNVGARCGERMRRGFIVVLGDAGDYLGDRMLAGSIAVFGQAGAHAGLGLRRGSLFLAHAPRSESEAFRDCGPCEYGMVPLIRDYLVDFHPTAARRFGMFAQARRWCGDRNHGGKGEILVALGD